MKNFDLSFYLVTDSTGLTEQEFLAKIELALQNGVTFLQLREKEKTGREYFCLAQKVQKLAQKYQVPFLIDDRVDIALAVNADGVHLGQEDLPLEQARAILGPKKIIGATAKTVAQAQAAQNLRADYLGVGAIYPTTTKVKTVLTKVCTLQEICQNVQIPVAAIGGLKKQNLDILKDTGIQGVCVVSAIMQADRAGEASKELAEKIRALLA